MAAGAPGPFRQDPPHVPDLGVWNHQQVSSLDDAARVVNAALDALTSWGYDGAARRRVRRVLEGALLAALRRGGLLTGGRPVHVSYRVGRDYALAEVEAGSDVDDEPAGSGPHASGLAGGVRPRFYAWLRCEQPDGRVRVCRCWSVP